MTLCAGLLHAASFDCGKARTRTEKFICSDAALSTADERMASAYTKAVRLASSINLEEAKELKRDQRVWLRGVQGCENVGCLSIEYADRTTFLNYYNTHADGHPATVTGSYRMRRVDSCVGCFTGKDVTPIIQSGNLEISKLPNGSVRFSLNVVNESNFHTGEIEGEVHLKNGVAVFRQTDPQYWMNCTLTITFKSTKAAVSQDGACGFGTGVVADGTYMKTGDSVRH